MSSRVGVVIVTYNSADVIRKCLTSCAGMDTIVVDNASEDGTVAQCLDVNVIKNTNNRGFAGGVNQGVRALTNEFILLLNPDVQLNGAVDALAAADISSGQLVGEDGKPQAGFSVRRLPSAWTLTFEVLGLNRLFPSNFLNRRYRCLDMDLTREAAVEQPAGAFLMFRKSVWEHLGGFDEGFHPVWFEDVDFCLRAKQAGYRIRYVPQVTAIHQGGHSAKKLEWSRRELYWYASLLRYACKHFRPNAFRGVCGAVVLGSVIRAVLGMAQRRNSEPLLAYARVIRLAVVGAVRRQTLGMCFNATVGKAIQ